MTHATATHRTTTTTDTATLTPARKRLIRQAYRDLGIERALDWLACDIRWWLADHLDAMRSGDTGCVGQTLLLLLCGVAIMGCVAACVWGMTLAAGVR